MKAMRYEWQEQLDFKLDKSDLSTKLEMYLPRREFDVSLSFLMWFSDWVRSCYT